MHHQGHGGPGEGAELSLNHRQGSSLSWIFLRCQAAFSFPCLFFFSAMSLIGFFSPWGPDRRPFPFDDIPPFIPPRIGLSDWPRLLPANNASHMLSSRRSSMSDQKFRSCFPDLPRGLPPDLPPHQRRVLVRLPQAQREDRPQLRGPVNCIAKMDAVLSLATSPERRERGGTKGISPSFIVELAFQ